MSLYQLAHEKRDEVIRIAAQHGATNVRILGSEAENDTEIDFLVDLEPQRSIFDMGSIATGLEDLFGVSEEDFANPSFMPKVNILVEPGSRISNLEKPLKEYISQREAVPL
jgi:uncharacterized protein